MKAHPELFWLPGLKGPPRLLPEFSALSAPAILSAVDRAISLEGKIEGGKRVYYIIGNLSW